jgi:hypothetical protein
MDGWMDGWAGGWMDGWMDGRVSELVEVKAVFCIAYSNQKSPKFQNKNAT